MIDNNNDSPEKTKEELGQNELENSLPNFCSVKANMAKTLEASRKKFMENGPSQDYLRYFK